MVEEHRDQHGGVDKALHFFPGPKQLLWLVAGKVALRAESWGGETPKPGHVDPVMQPRPTTPGRYVVWSYAPYKTRTWAWSKIKWGTPIKPGPNNTVLFAVGVHPTWQTLADRQGTPFTQDEVKREYWKLYGKYELPPVWLLNDFGPYSLRYFRDTNHNRKLDGNEHLSGEMIHTTPLNEAQTARSKPVKLESSHGCIHVKPRDRDASRAAGAFDRGTLLIVHQYSDLIPKPWR
ncbi:MAG TPA: hypothetical protein VJR89_35300 [Polyangiales bacterium]|nr:hypothetical protein [Polyangiales bacterium]